MSDDFASEDELRAMLSDLDPMSARVPVESPDSARVREQLYEITQIDEPRAGGNFGTTPQTIGPFRARGGRWLAAAAAVAAVAIGTTLIVTGNGGDGDETVVAAPTVLALQGSGTDTSMQMCMMFDVNQLRTAGVAFGGTVTAIDAEQVTLDVDRWFKGVPEADEVTIAIPPGGDTVAIDGVDFVQGERYLISATEGILGICGYSGPATPEFEKSFERAFPGA